MRPRYEYGDKVRVTRNVRNDGTYPGLEIGDFLIRRGSVGHVTNVGTFLQDQIIYTVHFLDEGIMVGCRQEELIDADAPWNPSLFEFRDKVKAKKAFSVNGEVVVDVGDVGEVIKVLRDEKPMAYHVRFPGRTLMVTEELLEEQPKEE